MADEADIANEYTEHGLEKAIQSVRANTYQGESALECVECGDEIPEARRKALPGVKRCVECQSRYE